MKIPIQNVPVQRYPSVFQFLFSKKGFFPYKIPPAKIFRGSLLPISAGAASFIYPSFERPYAIIDDKEEKKFKKMMEKEKRKLKHKSRSSEQDDPKQIAMIKFKANHLDLALEEIEHELEQYLDKIKDTTSDNSIEILVHSHGKGPSDWSLYHSRKLGEKILRKLVDYGIPPGKMIVRGCGAVHMDTYSDHHNKVEFRIAYSKRESS